MRVGQQHAQLRLQQLENERKVLQRRQVELKEFLNKQQQARCLSYQKLQILLITNTCNLHILHFFLNQYRVVGQAFSQSFSTNFLNIKSNRLN
jgi:hypothetical protein